MRTPGAPLSFAISLLLCATLHAQPKIVDTIAAASDPEMTYAAYVPASASGHKSPVVFVLDPRRRGAFAAELFRNENSYTGAAAQRVLAAIHGQLAFYLPQQVNGPRLNTLKTVAAMIRPSR